MSKKSYGSIAIDRSQVSATEQSGKESLSSNESEALVGWWRYVLEGVSGDALTPALKNRLR